MPSQGFRLSLTYRQNMRIYRIYRHLPYIPVFAVPYGAIWCQMVPNGATGCRIYRHLPCHMVPKGAKWCHMVPHIPVFAVPYGAKWCQRVPNGATWCRIYRSLPCHMVANGATWCLTFEETVQRMTFEVTFEETVQKNGARRHFTLLHFTLLCHAPCMDMHGIPLVYIYICSSTCTCVSCAR